MLSVGDPFKIFAEEAEWKRETLKQIWPELYTALAQLHLGKAAWGCALAAHIRADGTRDYVPVTGRLFLNGTPACAECCAAISDRPDGYPLARTDPKGWKS